MVAVLKNCNLASGSSMPSTLPSSKHTEVFQGSKTSHCLKVSSSSPPYMARTKSTSLKFASSLKLMNTIVTACVSQSLSDTHLGAAITGSLLVSRRIRGDQSHASLVHSLLDKRPGIIPRRGSCTCYNARNHASPTTLPAPLGVRVFLSSD